jgi:hypothetical protein
MTDRHYIERFSDTRLNFTHFTSYQGSSPNQLTSDSSNQDDSEVRFERNECANVVNMKILQELQSQQRSPRSNISHDFVRSNTPSLHFISMKEQTALYSFCMLKEQ